MSCCGDPGDCECTPTVTYREEEWEHGLCCGECSRPFTDGMPVCERLESMFDDGTPVVLIVCSECDFASAEINASTDCVCGETSTRNCPCHGNTA